MFGMKTKKWHYMYLVLIGILSIIAWISNYNHLKIADPRDGKLKTVLINEYEYLQPLPGAILVDSTSLFRNGNGVITYRYSTELNDEDILSYYGKQLQANGWTFQRDEEVKNGNFDSPERSAVYSKGEYIAHIGYGFKENEYHIRFAIFIEKPVSTAQID